MNQSFPLVSIIIPSYQSAKFVAKAIDSCLSQSYPNVEIIVIDDGSIDDTKEVLESYIDTNQISYIYKSNGRAASARNLGLTHAKGEFIQFLDADDILLPEKITIQIEYLLKYPNIAGVYCDYFIIKQNKTLHYKAPKPVENLYDYFLDSAFILPIHAPLIRNEKLPQFNESLQQNEDRAFWLDYFTDTSTTFAYIDIPLVHYCLHETNTSYNGIENIQNMLKLLYSLPHTAIVQNAIIEHHGLLGFAFLEMRRPLDARTELKEGLHTSNLKRKLFFFGLYVLTYSQIAYRFIRWNATKIRSFYKRKEMQ